MNNLTAIQQQALEVALQSETETRVIAGFAGTGKTEVLAAAARESNCYVLTPTNKAAQVLRDRGISGAQTLHSAIYIPKEVLQAKKDGKGNPIIVRDKDGEPLLDAEGKHQFELEKVLVFDWREEFSGSTALVDEGSMLKPQELEDLKASFGKVVLFGDPFQLPPVKARDTFGEMVPDVFMKEVHRTALESPITRYATSIREGEENLELCDKVKLGKAGHSKLMDKIVEEDYQAIAWTNKLRHSLNRRVRAVLGHPQDYLVKGEKIMSLENIRVNIEDTDIRKLILYNGEEVLAPRDLGPLKDYSSSRKVWLKGHEIPIQPFYMEGFWDWWSNDVTTWGKLFDFSYAMTAHKAQGSEWDRVAVWDQRAMQYRTMGQVGTDRWFYTAVTRAKDTLVIVR